MKICVLGAGAYGLALSKVMLDNNHKVVVWTKVASEKEEIKRLGYCPKLPNYKIPSNLEISTDLEYSLKQSDLVIFAVPAKFASSVASELSKYYNGEHIIIATKGIEQESCLFISDVISKYVPTDKLGAISGPSFAVDIVNGIPIGLSLGSSNSETISLAKQAFENNYFKFNETNDIIGLEICGAVKNVLAIASGMIVGMNLPISSQAMFITEALNEVKKLIKELGGDPDTILSFAGFGDILLTCTSEKSRNFTFGKMIGEGLSEEELSDFINKTTIEGLYTLKSIAKLISDRKINMPMINTIDDVVEGKKDPQKVIQLLFERK